MNRAGRSFLPLAAVCAVLGVWEAYVRLAHVPPYVLPAPSLVAATLYTDRATLLASFLVTLKVTVEALLSAVFGGVALAILFARWKWTERAFFPFAVILQVTPIIAIAPLLLVYLQPDQAVLACAFLVAFFPILSNTALGLSAVDHNLLDLFDLYRASSWSQLWLLRAPSALPYFLAGLRIGGGLSLIGAVAAEIAAGSAGKGSGLAFRIVESEYRLNIPRMYAALVLVSVAGIAIFAALSGVSRLLLGSWHDSARQRER